MFGLPHSRNGNLSRFYILNTTIKVLAFACPKSIANSSIDTHLKVHKKEVNIIILFGASMHPKVSNNQVETICFLLQRERRINHSHATKNQGSRVNVGNGIYLPHKNHNRLQNECLSEYQTAVNSLLVYQLRSN
jgi:hypothetical protein